MDEAEVDLIDAYWRAANYLSVGQIYLMDNPLLREPLTAEHVKPRLLGHWGTAPGLNLVYAHLNRVIRERDLDVIYVCGPGHGGPAMVANTYLEGSYTERYPTVTQDAAGMQTLFRQFSFPGGIPSHACAETPGSINEGGELGYSLAHAFGAAFDNPDLVVACVIGDGEAETGALATAWHSNKFLDPVGDGAVLPILHLNGWKIANPTVLARIPDAELESLLDRLRLVAPDGVRRRSRRRPPGHGGHPRRGARRDPPTAACCSRTCACDLDLATDGRVLEMLSEHNCQGWLEGYLLTGRHGWFSCYEAFTHIVDSMFNQHAKWLKVTDRIGWRRPIASLNYLLSSHVWRQDHNGFSHQDPGFIDHVVAKKGDVVRVYLPPDANCLLAVADRCLRSRQNVNVVVAGKQPEWQWLDIDAAVTHCTKGLGIWNWASSHDDREPDVVMACAGDVPTVETLAAVSLLRAELPDLAIRVVNVVDLMTLQPAEEHPHGISDRHFNSLFTTDRPVIFAYHGYPFLIHRLAYRRENHTNLHVRGYIEEGTTTTPFDMAVVNGIDRFHLALDVLERVPDLIDRTGDLADRLRDKLLEHRHYVTTHGEDLPEVRDWQWAVED